eukprot:TRINITY_DN2721_c0_g1_i1.p2 TRINITY_DN2721_c0_g1~~TRINITY_DN2721_c0_g1_i1.p2  ORF type:complete len:187 (-),score=41.28 TRINITY_DN2721_c0_g1_i1:179-739(-)
MSDDKLKAQLQDQLNRLITQLQDCEEMKDDLEEDEYQDMKETTLQQLREFEGSLQKMSSGSVSLTTQVEAVRATVRAAVSQAFKTPEVLKMFASKQPDLLRGRLASLKVDRQTNKITPAEYASRSAEVLAALQRMGETLSAEDATFLEANQTDSLRLFRADGDTTASAGRVLADAKAGIAGATGSK